MANECDISKIDNINRERWGVFSNYILESSTATFFFLGRAVVNFIDQTVPFYYYWAWELVEKAHIKIL
jgi:hypothetical protein